MYRYRPTRYQSEYLDALAEGAAADVWSPDGYTFEDALWLKTPGNGQLRRSNAQPTSWLLMDDDARASIRRRLRTVRAARGIERETAEPGSPESGTAVA